MKNTERFSNRVKNYVRYRPHYPSEIIPFLKEKIGMDKDWKVADIGSGTGISSELFLNNGNTVYGVEPNKGMREAAEDIFNKKSNFISIDATAEATTLPSHHIDLVVAGQAFHWFDPVAAKQEFLRIAACGAFLVLIWNDRDPHSDFQKGYEQMLFDFAPAYEAICQKNIDEEVVNKFFSPASFSLHSFTNSQCFDLKGLKGRLLSCSYAPLKEDPNYARMMNRLTQLFNEYNIHGKVDFKYICKVFYGKITGSSAV